MGLYEFAQNLLPAMIFVVAILAMFGTNQNTGLLGIWANDTYGTSPGQIGTTDINTSFSGEPFATATNTSGLIEDNNPFFAFISSLDIIPKVVATLQSIPGAFADSFSFLPPQIVWPIGIALLVIATIGVLFFLLNAASATRGGGV